MAKHHKLIRKLLSGSSDANFQISDLMSLLESLGFTRRQRGSHHIFTRPGVPERINLQADGAKAKVYQVRQVRNVLINNSLLDDDDNDE